MWEIDLPAIKGEHYMSIEIFGLKLFTNSVAEYLFTSFTCLVINLLTGRIDEREKERIARRMIGQNHDIKNAMESAFEAAVKSVFRDWKKERENRSLLTAKTDCS